MMNLGEYIPEREESARVVGKIKTRRKIAIIFLLSISMSGKRKQLRCERMGIDRLHAMG